MVESQASRPSTTRPLASRCGPRVDVRRRCPRSDAGRDLGCGPRRSRGRSWQEAGDLPEQAGAAAGVDERQRVERHVERRLAERPVIGPAGCRVGAEGDELLAEAEDLDAAGRHLREGRRGPIEQQPLRPEPDPHQRVAEPRPHHLLDAVREIGIEDVDVDADQRAGAQPDAVTGELPASSPRPPPGRSAPPTSA